MVIGVPSEIKIHEYRVSMTPEGAAELVGEGHRVVIEKSAGEGSGYPDGEYAAAGAEVSDKGRLFGESELIVKVKEPLPEEFDLLREGQSVFTYLHLAPNKPLTDLLLKKRIFSLAYETLEEGGKLPLLVPMSEIAGRMAPIMAAYYLQKVKGGSGILPTGVPGVGAAKITIIGAGVVGTGAARVAHALGMDATVINRGMDRLAVIDEMFMGEVKTLPSTAHNIAECVGKSDIVIGAVLVTGEKAPMCVTERMVSTMQKGSIIVDVSIDQGGCVETSRPTTHADPVYDAHGVIHYAVTNMPGAYPRTSTLALTNRTLSYIKAIASLGPLKAIEELPSLRSAVNTYNGRVVHKGLAASIGIEAGKI